MKLVTTAVPQAMRVASAIPHPAALPHLLRALGHRDARVRDAAADALPAYGDSGFYGLLRAAAHGNQRQRRMAVTCLGRWHDVRALQPLLTALANDRRERTARIVASSLFGSLITIVNHCFADPLWDSTLNDDIELQVCAARALSNLGDVRAILPLIRLANEREADVRLAARNALLMLLPLAADLTPRQARLLGANAVPQVATLLADYDEPLVRATITALHAIGDQQAIASVERLISATGRSFLHAEACRLLAVLNDRAAQEELRITLLRGSRNPHAHSAHLLRPMAAISSNEPVSGQMLRPSDSA